MSKSVSQPSVLEAPPAVAGVVGDPTVASDLALGGDRAGMVPVRQSSGELELILRMAADPNVSVEKIERLMVLLEQREARQAEMAFSAAMAAAQQEMRTVAVDAFSAEFCSYCPSFPEPLRLFRIHYSRNDVEIKSYEVMARAFLSEVEREVDAIKALAMVAA